MSYLPISQSDYKGSVRAATTANISLSAPGATIDGVSMVLNDKFLIKNQSTASQNGIYVWKGAASTATRHPDSDIGKLTAGAQVFVSEGTANGDTAFVLTTDDPITVGSTALVFEAMAVADPASKVYVDRMDMFFS